MTYHTYLPELGYVQGQCLIFDRESQTDRRIGMSDLLSPIYVVLDADEADAFWGLVGVMKMMVSSCSLARETTAHKQLLDRSPTFCAIKVECAHNYRHFSN